MRRFVITLTGVSSLILASSAAADDTQAVFSASETAPAQDGALDVKGKKLLPLPQRQMHFFTLTPQNFKPASHISHDFSAEDAERIPVAAVTARASGHAIMSDEQAQQIISLFAPD